MRVSSMTLTDIESQHKIYTFSHGTPYVGLRSYRLISSGQIWRIKARGRAACF